MDFVVMVTFCYGLNVVSPPNSYVEKPTPNSMIILGDRAFMEVIKVNEATGVGA